MSQQIINISTPDDNLGDVLRNSFDKTNQNFTELYNGKVDKIAGKGLSKNDFTDTDKTKLDGIEAGAEVNVQADWGETDPLAKSFILNKQPSLYSAFGYFHISDLATQTTPLAFLAATPLQLTNDRGGAFSNYEQAPYGVSDIWDTSRNQFAFDKLSVGDGVLFRADLSISTTSVNQNLQLYIKFGIGTPSEYDLLIDSWNEKSVITFKHFLKDVSFSIDNEDWRTAPAEIYILSDDDGSVKVNGWYIPIIRKSVNVIDFNSDPLKLNKDTTAGVERAYIINPDGSQDTKATSNFISPTQLLEDFYNKSAKAIIEWVPYISFWGNAIVPSVTGTADNVAPLWTGTYFQAQFRRRYASAVTAGSSTSFRDGSFRHTAIGEGFVSIQIFGNEDAVNVAQARSACALIGGNGEIGNVNPSTVTNFIGVANNSGQANLHFNVSNQTALNHNINLGSSFPANRNSTDFYLVIMINDKGVSNLKWRVVNLHSGADTGYSTITTGLPASTMGLAPQVWRNNGSTALAVKNSIMLYRLLKM